MKPIYFLLLGLAVGGILGWTIEHQKVAALNTRLLDLQSKDSERAVHQTFRQPTAAPVHFSGSTEAVSANIEEATASQETNTQVMGASIEELKQNTHKFLVKRNHLFLDGMRLRLSLTASQMASLKAYFTQHPSRDAGTNYQESAWLENTDISAILTTDQKKILEDNRSQQQESLRAIQANVEMLRLQRTLTITPDQEDKILNVFYDTGTSGNESQQPPEDPQERAVFFKTRIDAVKPFLTPDQMKLYLDFLKIEKGM